MTCEGQPLHPLSLIDVAKQCKLFQSKNLYLQTSTCQSKDNELVANFEGLQTDF